jgi:sulfur-oxidizing protein SoxY
MNGEPPMSGARFRFAWVASLAIAVLGFGIGATLGEDKDDPWPDIAFNAFNGRALLDGTGLLAIEMPYRAEDAAIVPVTVRSTLPAGDERRVKAFTIIIDENPSPVAATFTLGANSGVSSISTRVRVDSYTNVHAVAELSDGNLYVVKIYVKASGGCSAPAKNTEDATASLGQMRMRQFVSDTDTRASRAREAQVMIRHPNNSGLQMDQLTRLYVPPFFVHDMKVWQGDDLILSMDGGISISQDPNIRFTYVPNGAKSLRAQATDTENHVFNGDWPVDAQM